MTNEELREIGRKIGNAVNPESEAIELLGHLGAAVSASRPYEIGLNERLKDPVYAAAYAKALIEDGVSASPQPRLKQLAEDITTRFYSDETSQFDVEATTGDIEDMLTQFFAAAPTQEPRESLVGKIVRECMEILTELAAPGSVPQAPDSSDKCEHGEYFYNCDICEGVPQAEPPKEEKP